MTTINKQLHWEQRMALVRHNLHSASRSGDFTFFKTLQAAGLMEGTNHVATLSATLGDEADTLLAALDNLNSGLAYIHQDAFQNVYECLKNSLRAAEEDAEDDDDDDEPRPADRSKLYVDTTLQKNMADMAIDKSTSSAIALINQQPAHVQELAANVWVTGATMVSDCIEVSLKQMDSLDDKINDFIRLEDSWTIVKASVVCAITGLKGVFSLMGDTTGVQEDQSAKRASSASIGSAIGAGFRKLSVAFGPGTGAATAASSRTSSTSSQSGVFQPNFQPTFQPSFQPAAANMPVYRTPNYMRSSVSFGCPTRLPDSKAGWQFPSAHKLAAIPPTPAEEMDDKDPFDTTFMRPPPAIADMSSMGPPPVGSAVPGAFQHSRRISQSVM